MTTELETKLRSCLASREDVMAAWLFGSHARGTARADSDVDVAVLRGRAAPRTLNDLPVELQASLERAVQRPVDLVVVDEADADLVHRVLRDGVLLVETDRAARIAFEVRKRNEFFDMEYVRRRVRRIAHLGSAPMTESHLVAKKLAVIERCVAELRKLARPDQIAVDIREERFVEHTLQIAVQAALDVASHIVSDERLGEPRTNRELFEMLGRAGWLSQELALPLQAMAGFRNILVHGYEAVDLAILRDVVENRLGDLEAFVAAIRSKLPREG